MRNILKYYTIKIYVFKIFNSLNVALLRNIETEEKMQAPSPTL